MAVLFALLAASGYGTADFGAGLASRRITSSRVAAITQPLGLVVALLALLVFPGDGPSERALVWGTVAGFGSALGTMSLYQGLAVGRMSVVATLSAVLTAVLPALWGVIGGDHLGPVAAIGVVAAVPSIALVSWHPDPGERRASRAGALWGALAGLGFAVLLIALDEAHRHAGAWPLIPSQTVSVAITLPFARRAGRGRPRPSGRPLGLALGAGLLSGVSNVWFLAAAGRGELAIVAVLTALYPVVTVVLARALLAERWSRSQVLGLIVSAVAIGLVSAR